MKSQSQFLLRVKKSSEQGKDIRRSITALLRNKRDKESSLISLLECYDKYILAEAAQFLTEMHSRDSIPYLLKCLNKETCPPQVAYALGELGGERILPDLVYHLIKRCEFLESTWYGMEHCDRVDLRISICDSKKLTKKLVKSLRRINQKEAYRLIKDYKGKAHYEEKYRTLAKARALAEFEGRDYEYERLRRGHKEINI